MLNIPTPCEHEQTKVYSLW